MIGWKINQLLTLEANNYFEKGSSMGCNNYYVGHGVTRVRLLEVL